MKIKILIKQKQSGLSLIELMVAITIFALITVSVLTMYTNTSKNYTKDDVIARMQENGRFAIRKIAKDALLVDYWAGYLSPNTGINNPIPLTAGNDCGIDIIASQTAIMYYMYNSAGGTGQPMFNPTTATGCNGATGIVGGTLRANTNAVAFKTASSDSDATPDEDNVYIYGSGSDSGCILDDDSTGSGADVCGLTGGAFWQYEPVLYVIRNDTDADGNTVPVLCRLQLKTADDSTARSAGDALTLNPATDCMAEGIEQMHLEFGYDSDEDLVANQYISDITATQAELVVSIRIYLLVRSATSDWSYTNSKTYNMGSMTMGPFNDNYYRRVYSTTVMLRNPTAFIGLL